MRPTISLMVIAVAEAAVMPADAPVTKPWGWLDPEPVANAADSERPIRSPINWAR